MTDKLKVGDLNERQIMAYHAAMLERMVPNLYMDNSLADEVIAQAENVVRLLWERLAVPAARINLARQQEKLQALMPPCDVDSWIGRNTNDVLMALDAALSYAMEPRHFRPQTVQELSRAMVNRACVQFCDSEEEATALRDFEWYSQQELMALARSLDRPDAALCRQLRQQALAAGVTNIGLELASLTSKGD